MLAPRWRQRQAAKRIMLAGGDIKHRVSVISWCIAGFFVTAVLWSFCTGDWEEHQTTRSVNIHPFAAPEKHVWPGFDKIEDVVVLYEAAKDPLPWATGN